MRTARIPQCSLKPRCIHPIARKAHDALQGLPSTGLAQRLLATGVAAKTYRPPHAWLLILHENNHRAHIEMMMFVARGWLAVVAQVEAAGAWSCPSGETLAMGARGDRRLPERDGTADVPPWFGAGGEGSLQVWRVFDRRNGRWRVKAQGQNRAKGREGCNGRRAAGLPCQDGAGITAHILRTARSAVGGVFPLRCSTSCAPCSRTPGISD